jgi:cytidylate kinase
LTFIYKQTEHECRAIRRTQRPNNQANEASLNNRDRDGDDKDNYPDETFVIDFGDNGLAIISITAGMVVNRLVR